MKRRMKGFLNMGDNILMFGIEENDVCKVVELNKGGFFATSITVENEGFRRFFTYAQSNYIIISTYQAKQVVYNLDSSGKDYWDA